MGLKYRVSNSTYSIDNAHNTFAEDKKYRLNYIASGSTYRIGLANSTVVDTNKVPLRMRLGESNYILGKSETKESSSTYEKYSTYTATYSTTGSYITEKIYSVSTTRDPWGPLRTVIERRTTNGCYATITQSQTTTYTYDYGGKYKSNSYTYSGSYTWTYSSTYVPPRANPLNYRSNDFVKTGTFVSTWSVYTATVSSSLHVIQAVSTYTNQNSSKSYTTEYRYYEGSTTYTMTSSSGNVFDTYTITDTFTKTLTNTSYNTYVTNNYK